MNDRPHATNESSPSELWIEGQYAVLAILVLALGLSAFGIVYVYRQQRRPIDFWGTDAALLIARAPQVMALRLAETGSVRPPETVAAQSVEELGQQQLRVAEQVEVSRAGGFTHVRRSLVTDKAFDWSVPPPSEPEWQYAMEFRDGDQRETVLIALDDATIGRLGSEKRASIAPAVEALREFLEEQFESSKASSK